MHHRRTERVKALTGIGVDRVGARAAQASNDALRLENLDTDIPPDAIVRDITAQATDSKSDNSYLPFIGQLELREAAAAHVSRMTGGTVTYSGQKNCIISAGGLSGILNTLFATVNPGEGVIMTDPTYSGLINRVKLVGAVPILVPLKFKAGEPWKFDHQQLINKIESSGVKVTAMLLMSPALPTGLYLNREDWQSICEVCVEHDMFMILDAAFERLLFDGREVIHPASFPGMVERTITVGSASKELRMIGWRIGWVVGPEWLMSDLGLVGMANVVVPPGITQKAVEAALENSYETLPEVVKELQARRDVCIAELKGLPLGVPSGGWSFIVRVGDVGWSGKDASEALINHDVFTTPMDGWGEVHGSEYIRIVFANEPCDRLKGLGAKICAALGLVQQ
jgi:N-succinyldiaminopimelate aminotransferase